MARSTGIIIAIGGITLVNQSVLHDKPVDWRIPIATGFAAGGFALMERANAGLTVTVAWVALVTVLLTRTTPGVPAPAETMLKVWNGG